MDINELFDKINRALEKENSSLYQGYSPNHSTNNCSINGCKNTVYAVNLCNAHYLRKKKGKDMLAPVRHVKRSGEQKICSECGTPTKNKGGWGLCQSHYTKKRREIIRQVCIDEMGGKCKKCGVSFPAYVYDFHHRNPSEKEDAIGNYINNWPIKKMAEEVVKCDLLCANCHRIEHYERKLCEKPSTGP